MLRGGKVTECGMYLLFFISKDCRDNLLYFAKIKESADKEVDLSNLKIHKIVEKFEADYEVSDMLRNTIKLKWMCYTLSSPSGL